MSNLQAAAQALKANKTPNTQLPTSLPQTYKTAQAVSGYQQLSDMKKEIGRAIKVERSLQNLTQRGLARLSGFSQGSVTRSENYGATSTLCLVALVDALGKKLVLADKT